MSQTKHALSAHTWAEVIGILTARLADSIDRNGAVRRDDPRLRLAERLSGRAGGAFPVCARRGGTAALFARGERQV